MSKIWLIPNSRDNGHKVKFNNIALKRFLVILVIWSTRRGFFYVIIVAKIKGIKICQKAKLETEIDVK